MRIDNNYEDHDYDNKDDDDDDDDDDINCGDGINDDDDDDDDDIGYISSNIYLFYTIYSDLQSYKSQPLQRVSLRQNVTLADRMWNGNAEKQNVGIVPDTRDFKSTYNQDFDSSILKSTLHT